MTEPHNNTAAFFDRRSFSMLFRTFVYHDIVYCKPQYLEYYQIMKEAFDHFFNCDTVQICSYDKHMNYKEFKNKCEYTLKHYRSDSSLLEFLKPNKFEKKHITYSLINIDKLNELNEPFTNERKFAIQSRGFSPDHLQVFLDMFKNNKMFVDLEDSRGSYTAEEFIKKLELVQQSKFYFGAPCGWSAFAAWYNIPRYHTLNVSNDLVHHRELFDWNKKNDILKECFW